MEGDKIHECKTCTAKWDGTTSVCDACLPIMKSYHDGHSWNSYTYTGVHDADENLYEFQCMECEQGRFSNRTTSLHELPLTSA